MTELEKIAYAKSFIDSLAEGINPVDGSIIPDGDTANNIRISRCYHFVSDILRKVIENGGCEPKKYMKKAPFSFSEEQRAAFPYSDIPLTLSDIARIIKEMTDTEKMKTPSIRSLSTWLIHIGALYETVDHQGKKKKLSTASGEALGIITENRMGMYGEYTVVLYTKRAQEFIIDNIEVSTAYYEEEKAKKREEKETE